MRIAFLLRSLEPGGAERQVATLAPLLQERGHEVVVVSFYRGGVLATDLTRRGVRVISLDKAGRWDVVAFLVRLVSTLRGLRPQVIYSMLPMANILGSVASRATPGSRAVWGIRSAHRDLAHYDWLRRLEERLQPPLARWADMTIANSEAGRADAVDRGFPPGRIRTVDNGIDTSMFRPDDEARLRVRAEWAVGPSDVLVGVVGRADPVKGHERALSAFAAAAARAPALRLVCVGGASPERIDRLRALARELGIESRLRWVGVRTDMPAVFNALDLLVLASDTEGFPNVVAEAMASGVRAVVTDVGDSARIVGESGWVVPKAADAVAEAIVAFATGTTPTEDPRGRIERLFSTDRLVEATLAAFDDAVAGRLGGR